MHRTVACSITVGESSFDNNEAGSSGVVIMYASSSSSITVGNSSFDNNEAGRNGGVMYHYSSYYNVHVIMENTTFHSNAAGYYGGVLYYHSIDRVQVSISLCVFLYNLANEEEQYTYVMLCSQIGTVCTMVIWQVVEVQLYHQSYYFNHNADRS